GHGRCCPGASHHHAGAQAEAPDPTAGRRIAATPETPGARVCPPADATHGEASPCLPPVSPVWHPAAWRHAPAPSRGDRPGATPRGRGRACLCRAALSAVSGTVATGTGVGVG